MTNLFNQISSWSSNNLYILYLQYTTPKACSDFLWVPARLPSIMTVPRQLLKRPKYKLLEVKKSQLSGCEHSTFVSNYYHYFQEQSFCLQSEYSSRFLFKKFFTGTRVEHYLKLEYLVDSLQL